MKINHYVYDLLGLHLQKSLIDTCLSFGSKHGSQMFQRPSDAVYQILFQQGYAIINYIDNFIGFGMLEDDKKLYDCLCNIL